MNLLIGVLLKVSYERRLILSQKDNLPKVACTAAGHCDPEYYIQIYMPRAGAKNVTTMDSP